MAALATRRLGAATALALVLVPLLAAGCRRGRRRSEPTPPGGQGGLTREQALHALDLEMASAMSARRKQSCPRPAPVASDAGVASAPTDPALFTRAITALAEPAGALGNCAQTVGGAKDSLKAALSDCVPGGAGPCPARALDDPASRVSAVVAIELACGALPGVLAAAARPTDGACSPYVPGRRRAPDPTSFLYLSRAATVLARAQARDGSPARALDLMLDTLAAGQELSRGGVGLSLALAATGAAGFLAPTAELLLSSRPPARAELDALAARLDSLIAAEPSLAAQLAADGLETQALLSAVPQEEGAPDAGAPAPEAIARLAADALTRANAARCPEGATLAACVSALSDPSVPAELLARYAPDLRAELTTELAENLTPPAAGYARKYGLRLALLAALRVHVELSRAPRAACPDLTLFEKPPFAALLTPAALGDRLTLKQVAPGIFELYAPGFLSEDGTPRQIGRLDAGCEQPG